MSVKLMGWRRVLPIFYALLLVLHIRLFAREAGGYGALRPRLREVVEFVRAAFARG